MDLKENLYNFLRVNDISSPKFAYGTKKFDGKILYSGPYFDEKEIVAAMECFINGKWSVNGEKVHQFENQFSKYIGQKESVMVNSGSSADLLMIAAAKKCFGWLNGDGIIVSPCGFPTTISAITLNNLKPIFIDIEFDTLNFLTSSVLEDLIIKKLGNVRAILVSPVLGNPPNIDRLVAIAEQYGLVLLLDGCDSLGTTWNGKHLSDYCYATTCSFFPAHHISTLQGGMISSNDSELISIARSMSSWGRACYCVSSANALSNGVCGCRFSNWLSPNYDNIVDHKYVYENIGYNLQPLDLQGAIGIEQLKKIEEIHDKRKVAYNTISTLFYSILGIPSVCRLSVANVSWFGVPLICKSYEEKQKIVAFLEQNNIQTRNYFAGNILLHSAYERLGDFKDYPQSNKVLDLVFFVGCAPFYTQEHFDYIEKILKEFSAQNKIIL